MERITVCDTEAMRYYKEEMTNDRMFVEDILECEPDGAVIVYVGNGRQVGIYLLKGKWCLYRNEFKPEYSWDTLEEAVSSCIVMAKMEALP